MVQSQNVKQRKFRKQKVISKYLKLASLHFWNTTKIVYMQIAASQKLCSCFVQHSCLTLTPKCPVFACWVLPIPLAQFTSLGIRIPPAALVSHQLVGTGKNERSLADFS